MPRSGPQFPMTVEGQLVRIFTKERLINERERKSAELSNKLDENATLLRKVLSLLPGQAQVESQLPASDDGIEIWPHTGSYADFRAYMQTQEREYRERAGLEESDKVTKTTLARQKLGVDLITVTRAQQHYGLHPRQWPPSTWPEQDPRHQRSLGPHLAASLAAGVTFTFGMLDALDGRLDSVLNIVVWLNCHVHF